MIKVLFGAVLAGALLALSPGSSARAGEWQYDPATDLIFHGSVPVARWSEPPSMRPPTYRRPAHVAPCPHGLCGYPLPIYKARQARPVARAYRVTTAHAEWCAARYRSYDARTDTYQPHHGKRRWCRSPWR